MATIFDPTIPVASAQIQSAPIRANFTALNDRTNQLTVVAHNPVSTSIVVGIGDKVYFEDNKYTPFAGAIFDLGSNITGVSVFNNPGTFKEIILFYYKDSFGVGNISFIEGAESSVLNHSTTTAQNIIENISKQYQADAYGSAAVATNVSPLDGTIILASIIVTNNGQTGHRGAINPIFNSDIIDLRPFLHRTMDTKALQTHISAPTLAQAHPGSLVTNGIIQTTATVISASVGNTPVTTATITVNTTAPFNPALLGYNPFIRITSSATTTAGSQFVTAKVLSANATFSTLTLDHNVTVAAGYRVIMGEFTIDRMAFDLVDQLSDVLQRDFTTGLVKLTTGVSATSAVSFTGPLVGDVTGTQGATVVSTVGTSTAANVHNAELLANAATNLNTASTIVKRDASGNFTAGTITASLTGTASNNALSSRTISTSAPLSGGGDLSANRTLSITKATTSVDGYLAATDFTIFNNKEPAQTKGTISSSYGPLVVSGGASSTVGPTVTFTLPKATSSQDGYLSSTDWSTFNNKLSGTVGIANGGTGQITQQAALNALAGTQTANRVLRSDGTNTTLSQVDLTTDVTGTLPLANGGTGGTTYSTAQTNLGFASGSSVLSIGGTVIVTFTNASAYVIIATYTGPSASSLPLYITAQTGTNFSVAGSALQNFNWIAIKI